MNKEDNEEEESKEEYDEEEFNEEEESIDEEESNKESIDKEESNEEDNEEQESNEEQSNTGDESNKEESNILFPVQTCSPEWFNVRKKVLSTMPDATIVSIQKVQNGWLWQKYKSKKKLLKCKNGGVVNEKKLIHGTRTTDPKEIYGTDKGFDVRFSAGGMWGRVNYFPLTQANHIVSHNYTTSFSYYGLAVA